ncbi:NADP-dependent oxidoreductase [Sphingobium sp. D43FB]|uniref:NADP-dependent oxidoreductase n=1 Tax=Sphingobium sp. D43FB TaxID=2017595 RepID=UPI000BB578A2|nr:NADP-dependent oxidoreductase [Sphingobium sp. D43FB]PBN44324.1 NADP-dependent oxidoreductase [Sphingobium sp. D43FB]
MTASVNRRFLLVSRPDGSPRESDFRLEDSPVPTPGPGEILIRNQYASLDPAIRGWLDDAPSYLPPIAIGDPVRASTIGTVEASGVDRFKPGDWVMGLNAIEAYSLVTPNDFMHPIDVSAAPSVTSYLSAMGAVGLTAWFGVSDAMQPRPGQTVLVSGAAGAVGSMVGQLAKLRGARVVGIAGGATKCARLTDRYDFDAAIDYRGKDEAALADAIATACPDGIDHVFENVGGVCLDAALRHINQDAQILLCGLISEYNGAPHGARNIWQLIVKTATMRGFLIARYADRFPEGSQAIAALIGEGKLVFDEHIEQGIDNAYPAFMRLFDGTNDGKMILKL